VSESVSALPGLGEQLHVADGVPTSAAAAPSRRDERSPIVPCSSLTPVTPSGRPIASMTKHRYRPSTIPSDGSGVPFACAASTCRLHSSATLVTAAWPVVSTIR
jgi:hypothetical protein